MQEAALRATVHLLCQESSRSVLLTIRLVCALVPSNPYPLPGREESENKQVGSASRKWRKCGSYRLFCFGTYSMWSCKSGFQISYRVVLGSAESKGVRTAKGRGSCREFAGMELSTP